MLMEKAIGKLTLSWSMKVTKILPFLLSLTKQMVCAEFVEKSIERFKK